MGKILSPKEIDEIYLKIDEIPAFVHELTLYEKQEVLKYARELLHQDLKLILELMSKKPEMDMEFWKQSLDSYPRNEKIIKILTQNSLEDPKSKDLQKTYQNEPIPSTLFHGNFQKFNLTEIENLIDTSNLGWTKDEINKIGDTLRRNNEKFQELTTGKDLEEFNLRYNENYKEGEVKHQVKPKTPEEAFVQLKEGVAESFAFLLRLKLERTYDIVSLVDVVKEEIELIEAFIKDAGKVPIRDAFKIKKNNSSFNPHDFYYEYPDLLHEFSRVKNGFYNKYFCSYSSVHCLTSKVWALCFIYLPFLKSLIGNFGEDKALGDNQPQEPELKNYQNKISNPENEPEGINLSSAEFNQQENVFCKGMPIEVPVEHFKVFTTNNSKNGKPFLTPDEFDLFIKRAFFGKDIQKQKLNYGNKENLFIVKRFYEFYIQCWPDYEGTQQCTGKYIRLLTDNFINWDYKKISNNFGNKVIRKWELL